MGGHRRYRTFGSLYAHAEAIPLGCRPLQAASTIPPCLCAAPRQQGVWISLGSAYAVHPVRA